MNKYLILFGLLTVTAVSACARAQAKPGAPPVVNRKAMTCEQALAQAPKDDAELIPMSKTLASATANLKKNPKNPVVRKAYVDSTFKYGDTLMRLPKGRLSAPIQYRAALALFRRVLAVEPKHQGSLAEKKTIDDIYAGMPGGIPK